MTLQSTCRSFRRSWNNVCSATGLATTFKQSKLLAGEHMLYFPHDRTLPVDVLVGCFSMIRRETFNEVGCWMKTCSCTATTWIGAVAAGRQAGR